MKTSFIRKAALAGVLLFMGLALFIAIDGLRAVPARADLGIVLGNEVTAPGRPSPRLQARLDKAADLYRRGFFPLIFVSGGFEKEGFSEARVMRDTLIAEGIPAGAIVMDEYGNNTFLTAAHTATLMHQRGLRSAVMISQFFHVPRARLALRRFGIFPVYGAAADYFEWRDVQALAREVFAYAEYAVRRYKPVNSA